MKRVMLVGIGCSVLVLVFALVVWPKISPTRPGMEIRSQAQFKHYWVTQFRKCTTLEAAEAVPRGVGSGNIDKLKFVDGSWVVLAWNSGHNWDAPWNAGVLLDSQGRISWVSDHFCGGPGFNFLSPTQTSSLAQFYKAKPFKLTRMN